jgi:hypothetical protein
MTLDDALEYTSARLYVLEIVMQTLLAEHLVILKPDDSKVWKDDFLRSATSPKLVGDFTTESDQDEARLMQLHNKLFKRFIRNLTALEEQLRKNI